MDKKTLTAFLLIFSFILTVCSYSYAESNVGNAVMNLGNSMGDAAVGAKNAVVNGAKNLGNDMKGAMNTGENYTENTVDNAATSLNNADDNYTATRTAAGDNNFMGMSDTTWTWLILGIVGAAIIGLIWYYNSQYSHRSYNND